MAKKRHTDALSAIIGRNIRRQMKRQGWETISGLARACNVTSSAMSNYIAGKRMPVNAILVNIAAALNVTIDELLYEQHNENGSCDN